MNVYKTNACYPRILSMDLKTAFRAMLPEGMTLAALYTRTDENGNVSIDQTRVFVACGMDVCVLVDLVQCKVLLAPRRRSGGEEWKTFATLAECAECVMSAASVH